MFENIGYKYACKIYFEMYPRRRKKPTIKWLRKQHDNLQTESNSELSIIEKARDLAAVDISKIVAHKKKQYILVERIFEGIPVPKPLDNMNEIKAAYRDSYRTQGYGANKYAKASLEPYRTLLIANGFKSEIIANNNGRFSLMANTNKWVLELILTKNLSLEEVLRQYWVLWKNNCHPKVVFPMANESDIYFIINGGFSSFEEMFEEYRKVKQLNIDA